MNVIPPEKYDKKLVYQLYLQRLFAMSPLAPVKEDAWP